MARRSAPRVDDRLAGWPTAHTQARVTIKRSSCTSRWKIHLFLLLPLDTALSYTAGKSPFKATTMKSEAARATSPTSLSEATPGILDRCARPPSPAQALPASHRDLLACLIQDDFKLQKRPFFGLFRIFRAPKISSISSLLWSATWTGAGLACACGPMGTHRLSVSLTRCFGVPLQHRMNDGLHLPRPP